MVLNSRNEIGIFMTNHEYKKAAEVGVQNGIFSKQILQTWNGHLTLIDAWQKLDNYIDIANVDDHYHEIAYSNMLKNISQFSERISIVKGISPQICSMFDNYSFDLVYLDANHSYDAVISDISSWIKKVKPNGCICGHDYLDGNLPQGNFGVKSAVKDFFGKSPDIVTNEDWPSWFIFI